MTVKVQNNITKRVMTIEVNGPNGKDAATAARHVARVMPGWSVVNPATAPAEPAKE
jgi:hypothetical protein